MQKTCWFRQKLALSSSPAPSDAQPLHSKGQEQHTEPTALAPRRDVAIELLPVMELLAAGASTTLVAFALTDASHARAGWTVGEEGEARSSVSSFDAFAGGAELSAAPPSTASLALPTTTATTPC